MTITYVGLGANLGDARQALSDAATALTQCEGVQVLELSPLYSTAPIDSTGPDYINAVARVHTTLTATAFLTQLQAIERRFGRTRPYRNAPRTLDLDLLLFGDEKIDLPELTVPHPRMHERAFVLRPLADLAPDLVLPQGLILDLLAACSDQPIQRLPAN